jgi:NAD(P)-dependent dehydrogenase (short-subunit alcohol dehydrogenase family)
MELARGDIAVITGAAGGLGQALARRCLARGMRLWLADLDEAGLAAAAASLPGGEVEAMPADVTRPADLEALASRACAAGPVRLLCNNAGVGLARPVAETTPGDWQWLLSVNLWGVIHGISAFLPRLSAQPGPSRIVNTASAAGFVTEPGLGAYAVSKHGVVALSETLARELEAAGSRVGVTVLCPAFFPSGIDASERVRPRELASAAPASAAARAAQDRMSHAVRAGKLGADEIAEAALRGVEEEARHVFPHAKIRMAIEQRNAEVLSACPWPPAHAGKERP